MRITHLLRQIEMLAQLLRDERGDTEWTPEDGQRVRLAHTLLTEAVEHEPESRADDGWDTT